MWFSGVSKVHHSYFTTYGSADYYPRPSPLSATVSGTPPADLNVHVKGTMQGHVTVIQIVALGHINGVQLTVAELSTIQFARSTTPTDNP